MGIGANDAPPERDSRLVRLDLHDPPWARIAVENRHCHPRPMTGSPEGSYNEELGDHVPRQAGISRLEPVDEDKASWFSVDSEQPGVASFLAAVPLDFGPEESTRFIDIFWLEFREVMEVELSEPPKELALILLQCL
jgi:hypothetical protein